MCNVKTGLALLVFIISQVSSTGVFKLELLQFTNDNGLLIDRTCCNGLLINDSCTQQCSTYFRICLKHFQREITLDDPCTYGEFVTPIMGGNNIQFPREIGAFVNPLEFKIDFAWKGDFSLILEAYHESEVAQLITSLRGSSSLLPSEGWKNQTWNSSNVESPQSMRFGYKIECDANFFGDSCTKICIPRNDDLGHYECGPNGETICRQGWEGPFCTEPICLEGCHSEHGYCRQPNECSCRVGWQGRLCNECLTYPDCQQGYCEKAFECTCYEGWGGLYCNQDLNYCTNNRPCQNGGTCTNTGQGSYTCTCPVGYTGVNCETEVDNCRINPCQNGGVCKDIGNDYLCECPLGYAGSQCQISAARCDENPCSNGGTCEPIGSSYRCHCTAGWSGVNCQQERNECMSVDTPCQNGGTCIDGMNSYTCACPDGFSGEHCEVDEDECAGENPCQNGGQCVDEANGYKCRCRPGFVGDLCQTDVDDCVTRPCANGGSCKDKINDFQCFCAPGYTGRMCVEEINECASNPCRNGASCEDLVNRFKCHCTPEYEGETCAFKLGSRPTTSSSSSSTPPPTTRHTTDTAAQVNKAGIGAVSADEDSNSASAGRQVELSQNQLILIVCLGSGIPMVLLFILVSILLYRRCRNRVDENHSEEAQQNAANAMNNRIHNQVRHSKAEVYEYPTAEKLVNDMETHQPVPLSYKNSAATLTANKVLHKDMIKDINTDKERQMLQKNVAVVQPSASLIYQNSGQQRISDCSSGGGTYNSQPQQQQQYFQRPVSYLHQNNSSNIGCSSPTGSLTSQQSQRQQHRYSVHRDTAPSNINSSSSSCDSRRDASHIPTVCGSVMSSPAAVRATAGSNNISASPSAAAVLSHQRSSEQQHIQNSSSPHRISVITPEQQPHSQRPAAAAGTVYLNRSHYSATTV